MYSWECFDSDFSQKHALFIMCIQSSSFKYYSGLPIYTTSIPVKRWGGFEDFIEPKMYVSISQTQSQWRENNLHSRNNNRNTTRNSSALW